MHFSRKSFNSVAIGGGSNYLLTLAQSSQAEAGCFDLVVFWRYGEEPGNFLAAIHVTSDHKEGESLSTRTWRLTELIIIKTDSNYY